MIAGIHPDFKLPPSAIHFTRESRVVRVPSRRRQTSMLHGRLSARALGPGHNTGKSSKSMKLTPPATVDGSEIRLSNQLICGIMWVIHGCPIIYKVSVYTSQVVSRISEPSTVSHSVLLAALRRNI